MENVTGIKFGQPLPPERWEEAADNLEQVFPMIAKWLKDINGDGLGEEDAKEFTDDAQLALIALRYVAEFASDNCRFIAL